MKKFNLTLLFLCILASGCKKKEQSSLKVHDQMDQCDYQGFDQKEQVFDENIEGFVFGADSEEDSKNLFAGPDQTVNIDEQKTSWTPDQRVGDFATVYFDFDRSNIRPDQSLVLDQVAAEMKKYMDDDQHISIFIEGHACLIGGSAKYNMSLSESRANQVKEYLTTKAKVKLPAQRLKTVGRGSEMCKILSGDIEQQAPNRRVEFYILR